MRAQLLRLTLVAGTTTLMACASDAPTAPTSDVPRRIQAPSTARGDALSPADSALCRSGYTLPGGRSCSAM